MDASLIQRLRESFTPATPEEKLRKQHAETAEKMRIFEAENAAKAEHWKSLVSQYEYLRTCKEAAEGSLETAARELEALKPQLEQAMKQSYTAGGRIADAIFTRSGSLPILKEACKKVLDRFNDYVAEMREWGAKNGIAKDVLAAL